MGSLFASCPAIPASCFVFDMGYVKPFQRRPKCLLCATLLPLASSHFRNSVQKASVHLPTFPVNLEDNVVRESSSAAPPVLVKIITKSGSPNLPQSRRFWPSFKALFHQWETSVTYQSVKCRKRTDSTCDAKHWDRRKSLGST